jgi:hypothetical protein
MSSESDPINNLVSVIVSLVSLFVFIGFSYWEKSLENPTLASKISLDLVQSVSLAALIASSVSYYFNNQSKKWFLAKLNKAFNLGKSIGSGIDSVGVDFYGVDFEPFILETQSIDLLGIRNSSYWIKSNGAAIKKFHGKKKFKMRIVVPNPNNLKLMEYLAIKHNSTHENEAAAILRNLLQTKEELKVLKIPLARVEVRVADQYPTYAYYGFEEKIITTIYRHDKTDNIPTIIASEGSFDKELRRDFNDLFNRSLKWDLVKNEAKGAA